MLQIEVESSILLTNISNIKDIQICFFIKWSMQRFCGYLVNILHQISTYNTLFIRFYKVTNMNILQISKYKYTWRNRKSWTFIKSFVFSDHIVLKNIVLFLWNTFSRNCIKRNINAFYLKETLKQISNKQFTKKWTFKKFFFLKKVSLVHLNF